MESTRILVHLVINFCTNLLFLKKKLYNGHSNIIERYCMILLAGKVPLLCGHASLVFYSDKSSKGIH